jgi:hypothetical protein
MKWIRQAFRKQIFYHRDNLVEWIQENGRNYSKDQIYYVLTIMINNKNEYIIDPNGRIGYLINHGEYYAFQPQEITDENLSIYDRTRPIERKPTDLLYEVRETKRNDSVVLQNKQVELIETDNDEKVLQEIWKELLENIENATMKNINTNNLETDWYKHFGFVLEKYIKGKHEIPEEYWKRYIIFHYLDVLSWNKRMVLFHFIIKNYKEDGEPWYMTVIRQYFQEKMVDNKYFYITRDEFEKGKLVLSIYKKVEEKWILINNDFDYQRAIELIEKTALVNREDIHSIYGFITLFKDKLSLYKTSEIINTKTTRGAICSQSSKTDIRMRINRFLNQELYTDEFITIENKLTLYKASLCVIQEVLCRYFEDIKKDGKHYFFNPEKVFLNM